MASARVRELTPCGDDNRFVQYVDEPRVKLQIGVHLGQSISSVIVVAANGGTYLS